MIFRPFTLLCLVAFLGAGMHVYQTKHEAAVLDRELRGIARKVEEAEARTQTLQAEWAWLNEPERLRSVAQRHLPALEAMQPSQFIRATEAERRLPTVVAYSGPTALFAAREATSPAGSSSFALLPRIAAPVQVAIVNPAPAPAPARSLPAPPVAAVPAPAPAVAPAAAPVAPPASPATVAPVAVVPAPVLQAAARPVAPAPVPALPAIRLALPPAPPRVAEHPAIVAAVRPAEPRASDAAPRPALVDLARVTLPRPVPRPAAPAPRPAPGELAALPPIAAPAAAAPRAPVTQVAAASRPALVEPPRAAAPGNFAAGSALGGGARPMLPPPVPFGSAGAATLGSGLAR